MELLNTNIENSKIVPVCLMKYVTSTLNQKVWSPVQFSLVQFMWYSQLVFRLI